MSTEPFAGVRLRAVTEWSPGDRWGTKKRPALTSRQPSETKKPWNFQGFSRAADGTRTHDLLHGKQWLNRGFPLSMRIRGVGDSRGLPAITVGSGNELVMAHGALPLVAP
jgi:hypothetical protein